MKEPFERSELRITYAIEQSEIVNNKGAVRAKRVTDNLCNRTK